MPDDPNPSKEDILKRLRRIEGQVRGVARMVEEDRDCREVIQQLAAIRAASALKANWSDWQGLPTDTELPRFVRQCVIDHDALCGFLSGGVMDHQVRDRLLGFRTRRGHDNPLAGR